MKKTAILETIAAALIAGLFMNGMWEGIALRIGYSGMGIRLCFDAAMFITIALYYAMFKSESHADIYFLCAIYMCAAAGFKSVNPPASRIIYACSVAIVFLYGTRKHGNKAETETENVSGDVKYYKDIEERYLRSRELWHDMRNHIAALNSYINRGDYEGMKAYTAEFCDDMERTIIPFRTGSMAADVVMGDKVYLAKKHMIDVRLNLAPLDKLTMRNTDLCVVLANLMDNAIEACLKLEEQERYINIKMVQNGDTCFMSIENPCLDGIVSQSSKLNRDRHGIGLRSVERIVHSYGGSFVTAAADGRFKAVAELR